jgi:hypothetical protein
MFRSLFTWITPIVLFGYSSLLLAAPNYLLQCLAKEEERLHKNSQNSLYRLNQDFVNEFAGSNDITIKKNYVDEICQSKKFSPSVGLLRLLLLKENQIYDLSLSGVEVNMRPFKMGYINEFQKQVPNIFIQYISSIQSEMPTANCLAKYIPELQGFKEKIQYLEMEIPTHQLIGQKQKIESIFDKLLEIKSIKEKCAQDKVKAKLNRMKKK